MKTLNVDLGSRSYPIHIGPGLLRRRDLLAPHLPGGRVLVVSNETVAPLHQGALLETLAGTEAGTVTLPDGEEHKTLHTVARILDAMVATGCGRDAVVMALGGGVIGDLAGFAAACFQRGVACIQLPTTLLAQVDSSVGGKTGVNHPQAKNLIGAFHQPRCVIADTATLATLDERQYRSGIAELVKYGLILDAEFFGWLEANMPALVARDAAALVHAVHRACAIKAGVVARDEHEHGERALLNLGHTFGHAIETATGYDWLHGEAVAAGTVLAAELSARTGSFAATDVARVIAVLEAAGLPVTPPAVAAERMLEIMRLDKKARAGRLRLVLLQAPGRAFLTAEVPESALRAVLADAMP